MLLEELLALLVPKELLSLLESVLLPSGPLEVLESSTIRATVLEQEQQRTKESQKQARHPRGSFVPPSLLRRAILKKLSLQ